jgi:hypothetical protein
MFEAINFCGRRVPANKSQRRTTPHLGSKSPTDERSLLRALGCRVSQRLLGIDQSLFHKFIDFFD